MVSWFRSEIHLKTELVTLNWQLFNDRHQHEDLITWSYRPLCHLAHKTATSFRLVSTGVFHEFFLLNHRLCTIGTQDV